MKSKVGKNHKHCPVLGMQKDSPLRQTFDQEVECLGEESNQASGPLTDLEQGLTEGDKDRLRRRQSQATVLPGSRPVLSRASTVGGGV